MLSRLYGKDLRVASGDLGDHVQGPPRSLRREGHLTLDPKRLYQPLSP
jgi:hypothetical protein